MRWLAEIVGFDPAITQIAREVPFMQAVANPDRVADRIDLVAQTAGDALGGPSTDPVQDLDEGEVLWLVPAINADGRLARGHWEMLSLDESSQKLLAAETVRRIDFKQALQSRLQPLLHSRQ